VAPPDPALLALPEVASVHPSVVKVTGDAPECRRRIEGSGFVFAPEHVMTNAHVVAGTQGLITVESNGSDLQGRVVYFDSDLDLAVIFVPGLTAAPLAFDDDVVASGTDALVLGYPLDGPYTPVAARVRDVMTVRGPNIYDDHDVVRQVYVLRATVRSGNSGGPVLGTDGRVLGVVFAAAVDDDQTGFALTPQEAQPVANAANNLQNAVDTGRCT
jgi:S1-C subfamily serine protease